MKLFIYCIYLLLFNLTYLYAGTIDPNVPDSKYIEYGKRFFYVGQLQGLTKNNEIFLASAVAIDDGHILTAAHAIEDTTNCSFIINNKTYTIPEFAYPQEFDKDNTFGYYDIAIGYNEENFNLQFYPELYDKTDEVGKICSISGFGSTGTFNSGAIKTDNQRRAGLNIIDYIDKHLLICSPTIGKNKTDLEFILAGGDSGGGLFIDGKLAGINSCVLSIRQNPKSDYATECGHTRISLYIDWIKKHLRPRILTK